MRFAFVASVAALSVALSNGGADASHPHDDAGALDFSQSAQDWSGFYLGVQGRRGLGSTVSETIPPSLNLAIPLGGFLTGLTGGANYEIGSVVVSLESDVNWANLSGVAVCPNSLSLCNAGIGWLATLRGRAGYAIGKTLIFGTAGVAVGGIATGTIPDDPSVPEYSGAHPGFVAGGGVEFLAMNDLSLKAEYNFVRLSGTVPAGTVGPAAVAMTSSIHAVKIGANWHF